MRTALAMWATAMGVIATTMTVSTQTANVERGKYLVEEIARCQECHTPRTETGEFDRARWMKGTTLIGVPSTPVADWHQKSPDISSTSAVDPLGARGVLEVPTNREKPARWEGWTADARVHAPC